MTSWPKPFTAVADGITAATPLAIVKEGIHTGASVSTVLQQVPSYLDLFIGKMGGCIGEISGLALILGLIFLLSNNIITWHIPVAMVGTIAVFSGILWVVNPEQYVNPLFHILTGGVLLGAIFMATDYVTSPMTKKGDADFWLRDWISYCNY